MAGAINDIFTKRSAIIPARIFKLPVSGVVDIPCPSCLECCPCVFRTACAQREEDANSQNMSLILSTFRHKLFKIILNHPYIYRISKPRKSPTPTLEHSARDGNGEKLKSG
ncbi:hypothetical protein SCLCIDRAFT_846521 [Scleroderma citrinum Foug A]|uniref:Uncharacterized protein n=1 Tax=Scleroderma citrinum Foug A TaxID=1036808 RepID=A0A0C3E229_9AGAM|nr:hypothetical protein SCLCIDRAFT_846521 [Scleroderma citrinum Foug A]